MTSTRLPIVVPAIPPKAPVLNLINSSLRPDKNTDPSGAALFDITPEQLALLPADLRQELQDMRGDGWTRGFEYAPENHWAAEVRDACNATTIAAGPLPAPQKPKGEAKAGGGTVPAEALEYVVTAVNANGQTTASGVLKITPAAEGTVLLEWPKVSDTAEYLVYRCKSGVEKPLRVKGGKVAAPSQERTTTITYTDTGKATEAGKEPPVSNTTGGPGKYTNLPVVKCWPFLVRALDQCNTWGFEKRDFKGRAERLLENVQYAAAEREFWLGELAQADPNNPTNYLTKAGTATVLEAGTKPSVARGLQILQDALQQCGFGGQGMIHTQAQTAPNFLGARRVANYLLDVFDNYIVPGVGYPGSIGPEAKAAAAGCAWMFATDLVSCRVEDTPTAIARTFSEMTDWGQGGEPNTITFWAQKFAAVSFDAACCFAVEVELAK
jgi:hypothetical protein